ncbi:MAG: transposase, partial [Cytophagales bacterium]|nr:transposase [Cytophagales bacterium]
HNLLIALNKYNREIVRFLSDADVPFDNNQAVRMVKTKQKISGCFRSQQGGECFARIRSFIATLRKQNREILVGLQQISLDDEVITIAE